MCLLDFGHIFTQIKYRFCNTFTSKANVVNTVFIHTLLQMYMYVQEEVHVQDNFTSKANISNTTHLLQGKWIYVVSKCGKISCLLNFGHIRA